MNIHEVDDRIRYARELVERYSIVLNKETISREKKIELLDGFMEKMKRNTKKFLEDSNIWFDHKRVDEFWASAEKEIKQRLI